MIEFGWFIIITAVITFPLIVIGTKWRTGSVTVSDLFGAIISAILPFWNIFMVMYLWKILDKEIW